jgi:hypothetical protein
MYNGKKLPEYLFNTNIKNCLFFELNEIFENNFLNAFNAFLKNENVLQIVVENIEPKGFIFKEYIDTYNFENEFKRACITEKDQKYINQSMSFYMLVSKGIIYSPKNKDLFCIYLDRELWIAIFAFKNYSDHAYFMNLNTVDFAKYFETNYKELFLGSDFNSELKSNWFLK